MRYLFAAAFVAATVASLGSANAAGGCGGGFHRGPLGECEPNRGVIVAPVVVAPAPIVVERPAVVVVPRGCPVGFVWRHGACRPI